MIRPYVAYALATAATVVMIGAVVFLAAWTLHYWQAWALLVAMFSGYGVGIVGSLARRDPVPIRPRQSGEARIDKRRIKTPTSQRIIESLVPLGFVALLVVSGLDHRFGWSSVPSAISLAADLLVAAGLLITYYVREAILRRSRTDSATGEAAQDRRMISTGPFAVVRHPMHAGTLLYLGAMPVALGSWWGLVVFAVILPLSLVRLVYEEKLVRAKVSDYADYAQKVEYRLLPHVW